MNHKMQLWAHANNPLEMGGSPERPTSSVREVLVEAANAWAAISPHMIVGCRDVRLEQLFPHFLDHIPSDMQITGAIQGPMSLQGWGLPIPSTSYYELYEPRLWRAVAAYVLRIAALTGTNRVVLDMEGALKPFHSGIQSVHILSLREAIKPLADIGVTILFYLPEILPDKDSFPILHVESTELVQSFAETVPNSEFMCSHLGRPDYRNDPKRLRCMAEMYALLGSRVHMRSICTASGTNSGKACYTPDTVHEVLDATPYGKVSVYPGITNLLSTVEAFKVMTAGA